MMRAWITLILLCVVLPVELRPCSTVVATGGGSVLAANNKDLRPADHTATLQVVPGKDGTYGKIYWGVRERWMQCGVNEAGLFVDRAVVPVVDAYGYIGDDPAVSIGMMILDDCATVKEAIALFRRYRVTDLRSIHYMIADSNGDAVVVEWDGGALRIIPKEGDLQLMTNFRLSDPDAGAHPCYRYNAMLRMLRGKKHAPGMLRDALEFTHQEDITYYSNIVDLTNGTMTIYGCHDFGKARILDIAEELAGGRRSYGMDELFPKPRVPMDRLERRNGLVYRIGGDAPFSGICYLLHDNGQLLKEGQVKNGICAGRWKYYDPTGNMTREDRYRRVLLYYDSGTLRGEGMLRNGLMVGPWRWLNEDGTAALEGQAMDGILYRTGEQHPFTGTMQASFRNGRASSQRMFVRGMLEGEAKDWYENGHLRCEGMYEEGRPAGQWVFYQRNGSFDHVMLYEDGDGSP
ncbi:MAG: carcinine hydrolase/isopenicillin-N N-acyltransferase family protein [Bacteroidota bacterium]|nr:carcinine hydrolase/isopenicillin-N N-acyltransferase family protein [Bacteroidota bacterium]